MTADHAIALRCVTNSAGLEKGRIYRGSFMTGISEGYYGFWTEVHPTFYRFHSRRNFRPVNKKRLGYWPDSVAREVA